MVRTDAGANSGGEPTDNIYWRAFSRTDADDVDTPIDDSFIQQHGLTNNQFLKDLVKYHPSKLLTFNQVVSNYSSDSALTTRVYCVADGGFMPYSASNKAWFNPHVRFLVLVSPGSVQPLSGSSWTHCIVGSWDSDSDSRFVQVASWDGGKFSFFSRENPLNDAQQSIGWVYQGNSFDAFKDETAYLGPFNGHVNGSLIMKELHTPWLHWYSPVHQDIDQCFDPATKDQVVNNTKWISNGNQDMPLKNCSLADELEGFVKGSVNQWMINRKQNDFTKSQGQWPSNVSIQRWMAHLLLTTTINIETGQTIEVAAGNSILIPSDFFYNTNANGFSDIFPNLPSQITALQTDYDAAVKSLGLALLQEIDPVSQPDVYNNLPAAQKAPLLYKGTLGGGKETGEHDTVQFAIAQTGEGFGPWTCLIPSFEDVTGAAKFQAKSPAPSLLSTKFLQSIFMVDYANPVYSWRQGVLMQYCPATTSPTSGNLYDLEATFVASVRKSANASLVGNPENDFIKWYDNPDTALMQTQLQSYLKAVIKRLSSKSGSTAAVLDYMKLAESKRRVYRPVPLDEFGFTLPFALQYPSLADLSLLEMQPDGTVAPMPARGQQFISTWTGTLWTNNPILLPTFPATLGSAAIASDSPAPIAPWLLPGKGKSLAACARSGTIGARSRTKKCPMKAKRTAPPKVHTTQRSPMTSKVNISQASSTISQPTWSDIQLLLSSPYWLPESERATTGKGWRSAMLYYGNTTSEGKSFDLWDESCVQENAVTIYEHLRSQSMPITDNPAEYWPADALETLRNWANQGFRSNVKDPIVPKVIIPQTTDPAPAYRTRKDIRSMTEAEINAFRAKLDDVLGCTVLGSKWQELCRLHGEWCLHYQEAFSLWHRAYLRYVEELIDFPIPYWNSLDPECSDPASPASGLPQAFLDQTYQHPISGETRPNPLFYALALDGKSTAGGQFIARDPTLTKNDRKSAEFAAKVNWLKQYQTEFQNTLAQSLFSYAENVTTGAGEAFGIPWQNLPAFKENMPDIDYVYSNKVFPYLPNFDGFFEQVHDNGHGWIGGDTGDMSDNAHTAADPIFLVFHANLDRVLDTYLSTHPQAQYTSNFPLRPFLNNATGLSYTDPRSYIYSTIGDMAKDTRALNYIYAPPFANSGKDLLTEYRAAYNISGARRKPLAVKGGTTIGRLPAANADPQHKVKLTAYPQITFHNVKCTQDSYLIDLFTRDAASHDPSHATNPDFLGRITRQGMGSSDKDDPARLGPGDARCRTSTVSRTLLLSDERYTKGVLHNVGKNGFVQVVTNLRTGKIVAEHEWKSWEGFRGSSEVGVAPESA